MSAITCGFCGRGIKECDSIYGCALYLSAALAHERDRARRVVRVFWRVRSEAAGGILLEAERGYAMHYAKQRPGVRKVYRVTVRRVAKKAKA